MARAEKDKQIKEACAKLAKHPEWLQLEDVPPERDGRHFQTGSLTAAANCFDFGKKRYLSADSRAHADICSLRHVREGLQWTGRRPQASVSACW